MQLKMQLLLAHECARCGEIINPEEAHDMRIQMALFGRVAQVCPYCGSTIEDREGRPLRENIEDEDLPES